MDSASSSPPVERYKSFAAFYPFYISEHAHAVSRRLHVVGTSLVIVCLVLGLALDWRFFVAAFCAMQVMMMATPSYVTHGDELAPDLRQLLNWGSWLLSLPVLLFAAGPYFQGAWRSLRARRIGMDVPVALGLVVTFVASTGATFDPSGIFGHEV